MGIKDLGTFIKGQKIDCYFTISLTNFEEKRIAIDAPLWTCTYTNTVYRNIIEGKKDIFEEINQEDVIDRLIDEFIKFNNRLMNYKITPIWIWDGVSKDSKLATKSERRTRVNQDIEKRDNLREELLAMNILERPSELIEKLKKLIKNTSYLKSNYRKKFTEFTKKSGLPVIIAEDEAENLASSLAVERIVAAVWTADTDTYPLGAPLVVKKFEKKMGLDYISGICTLKILKELDLTHEEFRDFCILCGTDFNDRIEKIGPSKALTLIRRYKNIETIEKETRHYTYGLKYKSVREQLRPYETNFNDEQLQVNKDFDEEFLRENINSTSLSLFISNIKNLPKAKNIIKKNTTKNEHG